MVAATVFHSKTATAPDDPTYNIVPSDWNSHHAVTMALQGADFANSNGVTFGVSANGVVTASVAAAAGGAGVAISAGTTQATSGTVSYANSNGVTWGLGGQTLTASVKTDYQTSGAYLTTAALSQDSSKYAGTGTSATGASITLNTNGLAISVAAAPGQTSLSFANSNGVSWGINASTITATVATNYQSQGAYLTTAALSGDSSKYAGTGFTSTTTAGTAIVGTHNTAGLSLGVPAFLTTAQSTGAYLTTAALSQDSSKYAGTSTGITGGSVTLNTSGIAINLPAYLTTGRASTDGVGLNTAQTNVTWSVNSSGISINATGYAGTGTSLGSTAGTVPAITLNSAGISFLNPEPIISSFQNMYPFMEANANNGQNMSSKSAAIAFQLPQAGSFSFLRLPATIVTNSTTVASAASLTSGGGFVYSTWNAVVYSMGTGANSQSLISVASGSAGFTVENSYSFNTVNSAWSITQVMTGQAYGSSFTASSLGSQTTASANFSSNWASRQTGNRFLDINFAISLSAGPYWLIVGGSTSSTTSGQGAANLTMPGASFGSAVVVTQGNIWFNAANDTLGSSGGGFGAGSYGTAGGTTSIVPMSGISSNASSPIWPFQMLMSA